MFRSFRWNDTAFSDAVFDVVADSTYRQMSRIHAWRVIAAMDNLESIGNRPVSQRVRQSMGQPVLTHEV